MINVLYFNQVFTRLLCIDLPVKSCTPSSFKCPSITSGCEELSEKNRAKFLAVSTFSTFNPLSRMAS